VFSDSAAAVSLWLQNEGFEITAVSTSRSKWGRIRFIVEFDESAEGSEKYLEWAGEYLDSHEYVVREEGDWTISEFVLLEELDLHPPNGRCRLAGCSQESDYWTINLESGRTRQYCSRHAELAGRSVAESRAERATNPQ